MTISGQNTATLTLTKSQFYFCLSTVSNLGSSTQVSVSGSAVEYRLNQEIIPYGVRKRYLDCGGKLQIEHFLKIINQSERFPATEKNEIARVLKYPSPKRPHH